MKNRSIVFGVLVILTIVLVVSCTQNPTIDTQQNGSIFGKVLYSNSEDHSGIVLTLDKTDGLRAISKSDGSRAIISMVNSKSDGSFSFQNLEAGTYTIYASSNDSVEKAVSTNVVVRSSETVTVDDLNLTATGSISGYVTLDGASTGNTGFLVFLSGTSYVAVTNDSGYYCMTGVPAGENYELVISKGSYISSNVTSCSVSAHVMNNAGIRNILSSDMDSGSSSLVWKGCYDEAPSNPGLHWAYYNTNTGCSYIYNGTAWDLLASKGDQGVQGPEGPVGPAGSGSSGGGTSISWRGGHATAPENPELYWAYFNTSDGCSYIYDGVKWSMLAAKGDKGDQGEQGVQGETGATGAQGETGAQGPKGETGATGATGAAGADGVSIIWLGNYASDPQNPEKLSAYYNTETGCSYIFDGTQWTLLASKGDKGDQGETGPQGPQGETGETGATGTSITWKGSLASAPGNPSLYWAYFNTGDGCSYIYDGTEWTLLASKGDKGDQGEQGAQGETGSQGPQGEQGIQGETGVPGTSGVDGISIIWLGSFSVAPANPMRMNAYYNTENGCSFIFDGKGWSLLAMGGSQNGGDKLFGAKLSVSVDGVELERSQNGTQYQYIIDYNANVDSETRTITITNIGSETVFFYDDGPIVYNPNSSVYYYDEASAVFSDFPSSLDAGCSTSFNVTYNPSKVVYCYIYLYNSSLYNPFSIALIQNDTSFVSSPNNRKTLYYSETMYSLGGCHQISSQSQSIQSSSTIQFDEIDFGNCIQGEKGQYTVINLTNNSSSTPVYLNGTPFIWIDGENADEFTITASNSMNAPLGLLNGGSFSASIQFFPKSHGEKKAVLHIITDIEENEEILIPIKGKSIGSQNLFIDLGYSSVCKLAVNSCYLTDDGQNGCYLIGQSTESNKSIEIIHIDSSGFVISREETDGDYLSYADFGNGLLTIYTYGPICKSVYGNYYTKLTIDSETMILTPSAYESEIVQSLKNPQIAGNIYQYTASLGKYRLGFSSRNGSDLRVSVYDENEELLVAVNRLLQISNRTLCVSGDYLYWFDSCCVRRININEYIPLLLQSAGYEHVYHGQLNIAPDHDTTGLKTYICYHCDDSYTEIIPATGHTYSKEWSWDENKHWHSATCEHREQRKGEADHVYPLQATAVLQDDGTYAFAFLCLECGYAKLVSSPTFGDIGPAGGIVFYDKGEYSDGWRYLEAAPNDLRLVSGVPCVDSSVSGYSSAKTEYMFGHVVRIYRSHPVDCFVNKKFDGDAVYDESDCTRTGIGTGANNTMLLVQAMKDGAYFSIHDSTATQIYAAKLCSDLVYSGFDDWFLPSKYELNVLCWALIRSGSSTAYSYWSSSEDSEFSFAGIAWSQSFDTGKQNGSWQEESLRIRPIRAF